ncbi:hypothetical protein [Rhizobium dioscoreae]|uniref:hypothetical protein n=1 Tax=Rhizobium TaxID=379 RepID=UPI0012612B26|nr:hypothetical protein [Rhizobium dioscoreae]
MIVDHEEHRHRITQGFLDAKQLIATKYRDEPSAQPAIEACLREFATLKDANDFAAAGWMMAAIRERLTGQDLPELEKLEKPAYEAMSFLPVKKHRIQ